MPTTNENAPDAGQGIEGNEPNPREEVGTMTTLPTDRPQPRNIIGEDGQHRLVRSGYMVVTVCRSCGAPLTSPRSVALQLGPTCARRVGA